VKYLQVAVVGGGFIGKHHIESIRRVPGTKVVAICERSMDVAKETAAQTGIEFFYDSVDEMLKAHPDLDVMHNCSPSNLHYEKNKKALEAGINVLCEKPFTLHSHESEELISLAKEKKLLGAVQFNYRHNAIVEEMKQRIKSGDIGKLWFVSAEYLQDWLMFETDYNWRCDATYGGNTRALSDIGSHCFDTMQYMLGEKIVSVLCKRFILHPERISDGKPVKVENEDAAIIRAKFESGLEALVRVTQVSCGTKNDFRILVEGTKQSLSWHQEQPDRLKIGNRDRANEELHADAKFFTGRAKEKINLPHGHVPGWSDAFTNSIHAFYDALRNDNKTFDYTTFEEAHHIMKITDACVKSDETDEWVAV
jgi:predicted dehydrogenase